MPAAIALLSALLFGTGDFLSGLAARRAGLKRTMLVTQAAGLVLLLAAAPLASSAAPTAADLAWGALAGLCGALGLSALYRGLAEGLAAVVAPVSALVAALLPVLFGAILGERPSATALVGGALCIPAIVLLSWEGGGQAEGGRAKASLAVGALAGLFLGVFYVAISRTSGGSGLWPLVAARSAALAAIAVAAALGLPLLAGAPAGSGDATPAKPGPARGPARGPGLLLRHWPALAGGAFDASANIAFLVASRSGLLMIVSVVSSLYPAPTVLLARVFFKQRIGPARAAGLVLALAGVALVAAR
ncbi:MAG: EamA family transporter [Spirochaetaceae bacterium]|nr:EamA family transporter [Spirochaetaceae bacterium]